MARWDKNGEYVTVTKKQLKVIFVLGMIVGASALILVDGITSSVLAWLSV